MCARRPVVAMANPFNGDDSKSGNIFSPITSFFKQIGTVVSEARVELTESAAARLLCIALLHPLDAAKTRMQLTAASSPTAVAIAAKGSWLGAFPASWFGGLPAALIGHLPHGALAFTLFTVLQRRLGERFSPRVRTVISACAADAVAALWLAPAELIKVRVQSGVSPTSRFALSSGGLRTGIVAQILRDAPFRVLYFVLFDVIRDKVQNRVDHKLGTGESLAVASVVGASVAAITTPVDVVRSRIMAQHPSAAKLYNNWLHCLVRTVRQDGIASIYRGVVPRTLYMGASVALFMVTFDKLRQAAEGKNLFETVKDKVDDIRS